MLEAREVSYEINGQRLLHPVSLCAKSGELLVIIGPNGAGKSTLLSLLSGYLPPTTGSIRINQLDPQAVSAKQLARMRSVVEQQPGWQPGLLAYEMVMMGGYLAKSEPYAWRTAMQQLGCADLAMRSMETLSGGERQRVHLARALLQLLSSAESEQFLLLDEPSAALDFGLADSMMAHLRQLAREVGLGVVAVVHDLNLTLRHADQVLLLTEGKAAAFGPTREVMEKSRLEAIYGVRLAELVNDDQDLRAFIPLSRS